MASADHSLSIAQPQPEGLDTLGKIGLALSVSGLLVFVVAVLNIELPSTPGFLAFSISSILIGTSIYAWRLYANKPAGIKNDRVFLASLTGRGIWGWLVGVVLTGFYVLLYWFPEYLGFVEGGNRGLVRLFDPLSMFFKHEPASQWFVYGTLYTLCILSMGVKFILKYRNNAYQVIRTISVMFWQLGFAFLLPEFLLRLNYPYNDFKNMWPLNYYFTDEWSINGMIEAGGLGLFMLLFGVAMIFIVSPILTYFYGKRWYCSWVCGCGGLAETAGDPWRQLSDKSLTAWRVERWMIHSVLILVVLTTVAVILTYVKPGNDGYWLTRTTFSLIVTGVLGGIAAAMFNWKKLVNEISARVRYGAVGILIFMVVLTWMTKTKHDQHLFYFEVSTLAFAIGTTVAFSVIGILLLTSNKLPNGFGKMFRYVAFSICILIILCTWGYYLGSGVGNITFDGYSLRSWYGFYIGSLFAGVAGVGFYPLLGTRVWCRFGCPMAAILGMQQKFFSRFRITTNGGQCISCGNCSTYCEMGIDVRAYAQKGQNIVRSSCVGCGICAAVCPRGVLKLENGPVPDRVSDDPILIGNDGVRLNTHVA